MLAKDLVVDDRYRLLDCLGTGAMGEVWRAQDTRFESRTVAVKFLRDDETRKEDQLNRNRLEMRLGQPRPGGGWTLEAVVEALGGAFAARDVAALRTRTCGCLKGHGPFEPDEVIKTFDTLVDDPDCNDNARIRAKMRKLFHAEANTVANLRHDNIVSIFDYGEHAGNPYLVMDYIAGRTLHQVILAEEQIGRARRLQLIEDLCAGLGYAHRRNLVHRDIKPANLIIDNATGSLKILDFGVVRRVGSSSTVGVAVGTFCYMSPEQTRGASTLDHRSDIFAVGLVLYELLSGRKAFPPTRNIGELVTRIQREAPPPIREIVPWVPKAVEHIISKAIEKQPENRYQDLSVMERELRRVRARLEAAEQAERSAAGDATIFRPRPAPEISDLVAAAERAFDRADDAAAIELGQKALAAQPGWQPALNVIHRAEERQRQKSLRDAIKQAEELLARGELTSASAALARGLEIDPSSAEVKHLQKNVEVALAERERARERAREERAARERAEQERLRQQREREAQARRPAAPPDDALTMQLPRERIARAPVLKPAPPAPERVPVPPPAPSRKSSDSARPVTAPAPVEGPAANRAPVALADENVQFTVYRPSTVKPQKWYALLAFAHLSEKRPDADPDELDPIEQVRDEAARALGEQAQSYRAVTQDSRVPVIRSGELRLVPRMSGVEFNPPERRFIWSEPVHREEFRMRAAASTEGRTLRGTLTVFAGNVLLAEVSLTLAVDSRREQPTHEVSSARPYRRIFASYSHRDAAVVREFEAYARAMGDQYLRDVVALRTGEVWSTKILDLIKGADAFQLFWSTNAMASPFVRAEWEHALALRRPNFVRPVYWEDPLPEQSGLPPPELRALHFERVHPNVAPSPVVPPPIVPEPGAAAEATAVVAPARSPSETTSVGMAGSVAREAPAATTSPAAPKRSLLGRILGVAAVAVPILALAIYVAIPGSPTSTPVDTSPPVTAANPSGPPAASPTPAPPASAPAVVTDPPPDEAVAPAPGMTTVFVDVKPWARVKIVARTSNPAIPADALYAPFAIDLPPGTYTLECENSGLNSPTTVELSVPEGGPPSISRAITMPGFDGEATVDRLLRRRN